MFVCEADRDQEGQTMPNNLGAPTLPPDAGTNCHPGHSSQAVLFVSDLTHV